MVCCMAFNPRRGSFAGGGGRRESVAKQKWMNMLVEPQQSWVMDLLCSSCLLNT